MLQADQLAPKLTRGLIVSCQAREDNPLHGAMFMAAMAQAATEGGAVAIRANGPEDIRAIRQAVTQPIIGLWKLDIAGFEPYITPTVASARAIAEAGADIIAIDATLRPHPEGDMSEVLHMIKEATRKPIFADIATLEEGIAAAQAGADYLSSTLSGYTAYTQKTEGPDLELIRDLVAAVDIPVIAEGRFWTPEQVAAAFALGAYAVVVGTAITNPRESTRRFCQAVP